MKKTKFRIFTQIVKNSGLIKFMLMYLSVFLICGLVILIFEPDIHRYSNALWYCFVSCSTIGFGDIVAVTLIGRIFTVVLYINTIFFIAGLTAVFTNCIIEFSKARTNASIQLLLDDLEHLPDLSKERLEEISDMIRNKRE